MYTLSALVRDCIGRVAKGKGDARVLHNHLISASTFEACWAALVQWATRELAQHRDASGGGSAGVVLPALGVIYYRVFNMGIRLPQVSVTTY